MTIVRERGEDGGAERESRFVHLLQPNRDMATNWCVDVGKQLESYLNELKATGLFDDREGSLNFAEAALLIQGSTQVYSRKVEYLYNLVLRVLDFIVQKKQGEQGDTPSREEDGQDCCPADEEEENFLDLDNLIQEEADIEFVDGEGMSPKTPAMKIPPCLRVTEGDSNDLSGDAAELASYNVAMCTMYRKFLLLDPTDSETVDKYYGDEETCRRERESFGAGFGQTSTTPGRPTRLAAENPETPMVRGEGFPASETNAEKTPGKMDASWVDWQGDGDDGMTWDDQHDDDESNEGPNNPIETEAARDGEEVRGKEAKGGEGERVKQDKYIDPWEPLNPYEPGTLVVKPFVKGKTQRKTKPRQERSGGGCVAKRKGVCFPEFAKALQVRERQERAMNRGKDSSLFENLRSSFFRNSETEQATTEEEDPFLSGDSDHEDNDWGAEFDTFIDRIDTGLETSAPPFNPQSPQVSSQGKDKDAFASQDEVSGFEHGFEDEDLSLEDLCRAHVDSVMQKLAESQVRTGLTARVTSWKNKIEGTLKDDESRPPFDIHEYGDRLLAALATTAASRSKNHQDGHESFANLVNGQPKDQVARSFSALLQLVNNGNVMIEKGRVPSGSYCYTAANCFNVKLLNSQNCHEGMFQHMVSPTNLRRGSGRHRVPQQQTPSNPTAQSKKVRTPVMVNDRLSPVVTLRTPRSGLRVGNKSPIFKSPASVRKSSRKRGQSVNVSPGGAMDLENMAYNVSEKGYTPVKLTPSRRQTKRKPLHTIQA